MPKDAHLGAVRLDVPPPHYLGQEHPEQANAARPQAVPSAAAAGEATTQAAPQPQQPPQQDGNPRRRRHYRFSLEYRDADGQLWAGQFLSVLPSIAGDIEVAKRIAKMRHGEGELHPHVEGTIHALCYMEACLVERPEWAADLGALAEPQLFDALAREVSAHMDTFLQRFKRPQ